MGTSEFSVVQFFADGSNEYVRRWVSAEEAVKAVEHYIHNVAVAFGFVDRVIITDGMDCTVFEWVRDKGIVFPEPIVTLEGEANERPTTK